MIWDRFDDAHDDVLKDIHKSEREIDKLKEQLKAAGVEFLPFKSPESGNESGPQGWYQDTLQEDSALSSYESYLRKVLREASA
jgi:hypothetical protein